MPIKDRAKYLKYQREYNKKRKQGCRTLHPGSGNSRSEAAYCRPEQQGVTAHITSQIPGCEAPIEQTPTASINPIKNNIHLRARRKNAKAVTPSRVNTAPIPGSVTVSKLDFSQLKPKGPLQTVGTIDRFRSLEEVAEAVQTGNPISGEELARLRRVGAKV